MSDIFMEPEEYEKYLAQQKQKMQEYYESLKTSGNTIDGPTLYELNQQIIAQMPALNADDIQKESGKVAHWLRDNDDKYYMLLCNELHYYTLFHLSDTTDWRSAAKGILDLVDGLGDVRAIDIDNNNAVAIWSSFKTEDNTVHCFYLFPYGRGVVEL